MCIRDREWLTRPFPTITRAIMLKDIKTFLRDTTQWSQLFLLAALIVVYLYNFTVLPLSFPTITRAIMLKDIKTFLRDTTQWSQLFLLAALIVVYLYNFKVLPLDRSPMPAGTIRTIVSFANLGPVSY